MKPGIQEATPPSIPDRFLEWYCNEELLDEIQGDLYENFYKNYQRKGRKIARMKFTLDVIRFFRPSSFKKNATGMNYAIIFNYIKVAIRVFRREKAYTFTNILGLALGIICSLFIYLWVQDELSYNQWPANLPSIHYVHTNEVESDGTSRTWETTPQPLREILQNEYPSIEKAALIDWKFALLFKRGQANVMGDALHVSPEFLDIFTIDFLEGDASPFEKNPNSILLTESFAYRYFGEEWHNQSIIGQIIYDKNGEGFTISGIIEDAPDHSTIRFEVLLPYAHRVKQKKWLKQWGAFSNRMFVKITDGYTRSSANDNIRKAFATHRTDIQDDDQELLLQPFADLYLWGTFENGKVAGGRIDYVRLLSVSAILILMLACVNFMNLTTARSAKRSKESGVRKVMGAHKNTLRIQFIIESTLIVLASFLISILTVWLLLPFFNSLSEKEISFHILNSRFFILGIGFVLLAGFLSGLYPAIYMASLNPIMSMKGVLRGDRFNHLFRKGLVVFQISITVVMIVGSITIYEQLDYIFTKNIGLDRENVIKMNLGDINTKARYMGYRNRLLQMSGIAGLTALNQLPINVGSSTSDPVWDGKDESQENNFYILGADPDFVPTMNVQLVEGRNFDWNIRTDTANYLINETAARLMNLDDPIGVGMKFWDNQGQIIGVVKDFHMKSLRRPIEPLIIRYDPESWMVMIRTNPGETRAAITSLETLHKEYNGDFPFIFEFLDENYNNRYQSEQLVSQLTLYFTIVAVVISCLGLLALVSYSTELKTKEIGVRKVLGASVTNIITLIGKEFILLVTLSFIIATPVSYLVMKNWLDNFAYGIEMNPLLFVIAGAASFALALLTISNHAIRSAIKNPVDALRAE